MRDLFNDPSSIATQDPYGFVALVARHSVSSSMEIRLGVATFWVAVAQQLGSAVVSI
jgi:hypothetical protein